MTGQPSDGSIFSEVESEIVLQKLAFLAKGSTFPLFSFGSAGWSFLLLQSQEQQLCRWCPALMPACPPMPMLWVSLHSQELRSYLSQESKLQAPKLKKTAELKAHTDFSFPQLKRSGSSNLTHEFGQQSVHTSVLSLGCICYGKLQE